MILVHTFAQASSKAASRSAGQRCLSRHGTVADIARTRSSERRLLHSVKNKKNNNPGFQEIRRQLPSASAEVNRCGRRQLPSHIQPAYPERDMRHDRNQSRI
jgi:hypothetical protein